MRSVYTVTGTKTHDLRRSAVTTKHNMQTYLLTLFLFSGAWFPQSPKKAKETNQNARYQTKCHQRSQITDHCKQTLARYKDPELDENILYGFCYRKQLTQTSGLHKSEQTDGHLIMCDRWASDKLRRTAAAPKLKAWCSVNLDAYGHTPEPKRTYRVCTVCKNAVFGS